MSKLLIYPLVYLFRMPTAETPKFDVWWYLAVEDQFLQGTQADPKAIRKFFRTY